MNFKRIRPYLSLAWRGLFVSFLVVYGIGTYAWFLTGSDAVVGHGVRPALNTVYTPEYYFLYYLVIQFIVVSVIIVGIALLVEWKLWRDKHEDN